MFDYKHAKFNGNHFVEVNEMVAISDWRKKKSEKGGGEKRLLSAGNPAHHRKKAKIQRTHTREARHETAKRLYRRSRKGSRSSVHAGLVF